MTRIYLSMVKFCDVMGLFLSYLVASWVASLVVSRPLPLRGDVMRVVDVGVYGWMLLSWTVFIGVVERYRRVVQGLLSPSARAHWGYAATVSGTLFPVLVTVGLEAYRALLITCVSSLGVRGTLALTDRWLRYLQERVIHACRLPRRVLVVGVNAESMRFVASLLDENGGECGTVVGMVDHEGMRTNVGYLTSIPFIPFEELARVLGKEIIDEVVVFLPLRSHYDTVIEVVKSCSVHGIPVTVRPPWDVGKNFAQSDRPSFWVEDRDGFSTVHTGSPLIENPMHRLLKRIVDVMGAVVGIILTSPLMVGAALAVKLTSPGPVVFRQQRVGQGKRLFTIYKFRTMRDDAEKYLAELEARNITGGATFKVVNDPRVTPVGRFLRKTSIDELPQLFNVLKGDMSLVGPRPLPLRDYERFYDDRHRRRFSVKPGITGLWQVSGRSALSFEEWMRLDLLYIDRWSLWLDFSILLRTPWVVCSRKGAE